MLIRTSIIAAASGSIAGNYFQRDKSGLHLKATPRHINNPTTAQKSTHKYFRKCINGWKIHAWTTAELLTWQQYCVRHPQFNAVGDSYILTIQLMFYRHNLVRLRNDLPLIYLPPAD